MADFVKKVTEIEINLALGTSLLDLTLPILHKGQNTDYFLHHAKVKTSG